MSHLRWVWRVDLWITHERNEGQRKTSKRNSTGKSREMGGGLLYTWACLHKEQQERRVRYKMPGYEEPGLEGPCYVMYKVPLENVKQEAFYDETQNLQRSLWPQWGGQILLSGVRNIKTIYWAAGISQARMARAWKNSNRQTNFACHGQVVVVYFEWRYWPQCYRDRSAIKNKLRNQNTVLQIRS